MTNTSLKSRLKKQELTIGSWITLGDNSVAEIMAKSGFDWLAVDMEHSAITLDKCQDLVRVIELSSVAALVRVGENNPNLIKRAMDTGAHGVIVPMINTKDDAFKAVSAVKYPPVGSRGVGLTRAQGYGLEFEKYRDWVNKESVVIVQIEHIEAVDNLEDILSVRGVDGFIIGPYDLSGSLGVPGKFEDKRVKAAFKKVLEVSCRLKKPAGFHVISSSEDMLVKRIREGYRFLGFSLDEIFLRQSCTEKIKNIRKALRNKQ